MGLVDQQDRAPRPSARNVVTSVASGRSVERTLGKRRILELYLNVAEFGPGTYGVGLAAQAYFGKAPADLGEEEAALLERRCQSKYQDERKRGAKRSAGKARATGAIVLRKGA